MIKGKNGLMRKCVNDKMRKGKNAQMHECVND